MSKYMTRRKTLALGASSAGILMVNACSREEQQNAESWHNIHDS